MNEKRNSSAIVWYLVIIFVYTFGLGALEKIFQTGQFEFLSVNKRTYKMSLIKNDIPILEYDINSEAVIMPGHSTNFKFPERAVMLFMEKEIDDYVMTNECEIIGQFVSITKIFPVY